LGVKFPILPLSNKFYLAKHFHYPSDGSGPSSILFEPQFSLLRMWSKWSDVFLQPVALVISNQLVIRGRGGDSLLMIGVRCYDTEHHILLRQPRVFSYARSCGASDSNYNGSSASSEEETRQLRKLRFPCMSCFESQTNSNSKSVLLSRIYDRSNHAYALPWT
jgi:hypothetical protein